MPGLRQTLADGSQTEYSRCRGPQTSILCDRSAESVLQNRLQQRASLAPRY